MSAVADVIDIKEHLGVDEYIDVSVEPLPISISTGEIYALHRLLLQRVDDLVSRASLPSVHSPHTAFAYALFSFRIMRVDSASESSFRTSAILPWPRRLPRASDRSSSA